LQTIIQVCVSTLLTAVLVTLGGLDSEVIAHAQRDGNAQPPGKGDGGKSGGPSTKPSVKLGLTINDPRAFQGYTVLATMNTKRAYLIDMNGRVVHRWQTDSNSHHCTYLLENGHLVRPADLGGVEKAFGGGPGALGRIQEFTWDGQLVWDFKLCTEKQLLHHDVTRMPGGNFLLIVWDKKNKDAAIAAGRKKELVGDYLVPDSLVEIKPTGKTSGDVVWEWHLWDHLVQDHDSTKANFGNVSAHPELVDINYADNQMAPAAVAKTKGGTAKLQAIGYVGSPASRAQRVDPDWTHFNAVDYNPDLDQVIVSVHGFSEFWIIDHSTTTAEAAGHTGGRGGKGGDLLYRWGNPRAYRSGRRADRRLFAQHNAQWIPRGLPGASHVLVFNNGGQRSDGNYSSVDEIVLPIDEKGHYAQQSGSKLIPEKPIWSYSAPKKADFYSAFISGAHRLPNGNTQICSGANGTIFEVTPDKEIVWKYVNPAKGGFGPGGPGGPPRPNQVLPGFVQDMLNLSPDQRKGLDALQKEVDAQLEKTLTAAQRKQLEPRGGRTGPGGPAGPGPGGPPGPPGGSGAMPEPGQIISTAAQITLKATPEQRKGLSQLQKTVDARLDTLLKEGQKKQLTQLRKDFLRGGPPGGGPGGPGGPPPFLFAGPPGGASLFRAYRYGTDYAGLAGKDLKPGETVEELEKKESERK
jgi:hypothetical protein